MIPDSVKNLQTGHVGLNVSDLDRSKGFYQQVFGFEVWVNPRKKGAALSS